MSGNYKDSKKWFLIIEVCSKTITWHLLAEHIYGGNLSTVAHPLSHTWYCKECSLIHIDYTFSTIMTKFHTSPCVHLFTWQPCLPRSTDTIYNQYTSYQLCVYVYILQWPTGWPYSLCLKTAGWYLDELVKMNEI